MKDNPGNLLISGGVLHEAVEKTFKDFVNKNKEQNEALESTKQKGNNTQSMKARKQSVKIFKKLNDMMRDIGLEEEE